MPRVYRKQIINPFPDSLDRNLYAAYVSGLTVGEGSFVIAFKGVIQCRFIISLRLDDIALLDRVRSFFGCGRFVVDKTNPKRPNSKPKASFIVARIGDLNEIIVPHFEKNPMHDGKKHRDFCIWKQAVEFIYRRIKESGLEKPKWSMEDRQSIVDLAMSLKEIRKYTEQDLGKYSHNDFLRPWPSSVELEHDGKTMTLIQWAEEKAIPYMTIAMRFRRHVKIFGTQPSLKEILTACRKLVRPNAKITENDVREIRERRISGETLRSIASSYGFTEAAICAICLRRNWKNVK